MFKGICAVLIVCLLVAFSPVFGAISSSAHDFSGDTWNTNGRICEPCHTPHGGDTTVADAPLWNHELTAATYVVYSSTTLDATVGQPDGISKLCLSCHDGTVAQDSFGGVTGSTKMLAVDDAYVGTDLKGDHPISLTYDTALATADGGLFDPSVALSGLGGTIAADLLFGGKLECASCHDVHNKDNNAGLLRIANNVSALCMTCHDK